MDLILDGSKPRKITKLEEVSFLLETSGLYLIEVTARVQGEKQIKETDDEDLKIEIHEGVDLKGNILWVK